MNETICWMCSKTFSYTGEKYQDIVCPNCGVECSVYNPNEPPLTMGEPDPFDLVDNEPQTEEEEMIDYGNEKFQGKYVFLPLMGETAVFDIAELGEVKSENAKINFREDVPVMANGEQVIDDDGEPVFKKKDLGYHIEGKLTNGKILVITSLSALMQVFKKNNIQDGEKVKIFHKDKGEWVVEKL